MDEIQLAALIKRIQEEFKMPKWRFDYASQLAYNLQVHTKGLMLDKITGLYPHEHPESRDHCVNSYEAITKGSIWKAINNIVRIFNNSSYNIQISEATQELIETYQKKEGSFFSEFLEDWIKNAVATDPNGICVAYPPEYSGDLYRYVCFKDLVIEPTEDMLIFISEQESTKTLEFENVALTREMFFDTSFEEDGLPNRFNFRHGVVRTFNRRLEVRYTNKVYHVFTRNEFIRFYKTDPAQTQWEYEIFPFTKELETLPYFLNGGNEIEHGIYESFVQAFVPFGNLCLEAHRNQRACELLYYYPRMSEVQTECDECNGTGMCVYNDHQDKCHKCRGSKYISIQSPYKVYKKIPNNTFDAGGEILKTDSVQFYSPDTGILKIVQDQYKNYLEQAEEAVFVQQRQDTGNTQAAKSKEIDREELYSWLSNIAKTFYSNLQMVLQYIENYASANPITVTVEKPYSFAILTESEAFDALNIMLSSTAPVPIKANQIDSFVNKFISDSSPVKRALGILKKYDLLLFESDDTLANYRGMGILDSQMIQKHVLAYPALIKLYEMDKTLFDQNDDRIIQKLDAELLKYPLGQSLKTALINTPVKPEPLAVAG